MAQKTNPTSLRLQKTNRHFNSCWYSDYFYTDFITQELKTRSYIERVFKQMHYAIPHLFIQKLYKSIQLHAFFFDPRGVREQKQHRFRLQKRKSLKTSSNSFLQRIPPKWSPKNKITSGFSFLYKKEKPEMISGLNNSKVVDKKLAITETLFEKEKELNRLKPALRKSSYSKSNGQEQALRIQKEQQIDWPAAQKESGLRYILLQAKFKNQQNLFTSKVTGGGKHNAFLLSLYEKNSKFAATLLFILHKARFVKELYTLSARNKIDNNKSAETLKSHTFTNYLENQLSAELQNLVTFHSIRLLSELQNASFLAEEIVFFLERRVSFRRIKDHVLKQLKHISASTSAIKGIRLCCSGRLGGRSKKAQKAKTESVQWGETSLNVLSSKLCFASKSALTPFGKIGVKVWLCYK